MKRIPLFASLLICLGAAVHMPKNPPQLLTRTAHCLAIKNFLPQLPDQRRSFGYFLDEKSYPREKVIYVVNDAGPRQSKGWVFVVFLAEHGGQQHFNIQNNGRFVLSKDNFDGVSFVDPPLGGAWTQQHVAMAIRRIETQARFTVYNKDLLAATPSATCKSYTEDLRSHF